MLVSRPANEKLTAVSPQLKFGTNLNEQLQLAGLTGESNRKMNEEDALIEEQAFMENLTKAELRESRALCSSLRVKLKYYGDEIARLRFVVTIDECSPPC